MVLSSLQGPESDEICPLQGQCD